MLWTVALRIKARDIVMAGLNARGLQSKPLITPLSSEAIIGASLSDPLLDELAGAFLWYIYIYLYPWAVHLVPRGPPVNAQRANVRPAE